MIWRMKRLKKLKTLIFSMIKVGCMGFGGGNALIPVIEEEAVKDKKLVSCQEYDRTILAATLTPGALPVELAAGIGYASCGKKGMVAGSVAMTLPGALLTILLLMLMGQAGAGVLEQIQYASVGVTAVIMCLLTQYILETFKSCYDKKKKCLAFVSILLVFALTGAKTVARIAGYSGDFVPRFSTIQILVLALAGSAVYSLKRGKPRKSTRKREFPAKNILETLGVWVAFVLALWIPAMYLFGGESVWFGLKGIASSLLSFGGGDAYLTIADGMFVPDYISSNEFYNHLVLLVNILPGSILCKTMAGIGFFFGSQLGGMTGGISLALLGFGASVAASGGVFQVMYLLGDWLSGKRIFYIIKKTLRIVVSGLLLTVMASLIFSSMEMNANEALPRCTVLLLTLGIYGVNLILHLCFRCRTKVLLFVSLLLSMGFCNILGV